MNAVLEVIAGIVGAVASIVVPVVIYKLERKHRHRMVESDPKKQLPVSVADASCWNIPPPHPHFTGREDLLRTLQEHLYSSSYVALTQVQAITGLGGIGKTQLALEYARSHRGEFDLGWWIRAERRQTLVKDFLNLATCLGLISDQAGDEDAVIAIVNKWLSTNSRWLLIFDNAESQDDIANILPSDRRGQIIITSRNPVWGGMAETLPVSAFSFEDSIQFLLKRTTSNDRKSAETISVILGGLPLALEQAAAYTEEVGGNLSDYAGRLIGSDPPIPKPIYAQTPTVATTFRISLSRIRRADRLAINIIMTCAFLAPDDIPLEIFRKRTSMRDLVAGSYVSTDERLDAAIALIRRYSLVTRYGDALTIHRLVQSVARSARWNRSEARIACRAIRMLRDTFPNVDDVDSSPLSDRLVPHVIAAAEHVQRLNCAPSAIADLLNLAADRLDRMRAFAGAAECARLCSSIADENSEISKVQVFRAKDNLGRALRGLGNYDAAISLHEATLRQRLSSGSASGVALAASHDALGHDYYETGRYAESAESHRKALRLRESVFGVDSYEVSLSLEGIANALRGLKDYSAAYESYEKALEIRTNLRGLDNLSVAGCLHGKGYAAEGLSYYQEAADLHIAACDVITGNLGSDNYRFAEVVDGLGRALCALDRLEESETAHQAALNVYLKHLGPSHPRLCHTYIGLGNVLRARHEWQEALNAHETGLTIGMEKLGSRHPWNMENAIGIALSYRGLNDLESAKRFLVLAADLAVRAYGRGSEEYQLIQNIGKSM
jgi:tetratricopeptide (TPR) repeat protein